MNWFLFALLTSGFAFASPSKECQVWFNQSKINSRDTDCLEKCGTIGTGMDTFICPQACPGLCSATSDGPTILGRLMYYPGLTGEERKLVSRLPREALTVFSQKQRAESATDRVFKRDAQEDESDAFRHFVWAGLLSKELGPELAKEFLDAHESSGQSDDPNRAMDLANNRAGLLAADRLRKKGNLNQDELEKAALHGIRSKELIVLKPRGFQ